MSYNGGASTKQIVFFLVMMLILGVTFYFFRP